MEKRTHVYTPTKRSIVKAVLDGKYTIDHAAFIVRVTPETVKRWLNRYGHEFLSETTTIEVKQPLAEESLPEQGISPPS